MELSVLLAEQIVVIFLMMAIGYVIVKIRLFKTEDSSVLSNLHPIRYYRFFTHGNQAK